MWWKLRFACGEVHCLEGRMRSVILQMEFVIKTFRWEFSYQTCHEVARYHVRRSWRLRNSWFSFEGMMGVISLRAYRRPQRDSRSMIKLLCTCSAKAGCTFTLKTRTRVPRLELCLACIHGFVMTFSQAAKMVLSGCRWLKFGQSRTSKRSR